jgi:hypothetical protein
MITQRRVYGLFGRWPLLCSGLCVVVPQLLVLVMVCLLMGCAESAVRAIPAAPVEIADQTIADEKAMLAVERSYLAAGAAIEAASAAGLIKGALARRVDRLDGMAMTAILAMRAAYDTGNAPSFAVARTQAAGALEQIRVLIATAEGT